MKRERDMMRCQNNMTKVVLCIVLIIGIVFTYNEPATATDNTRPDVPENFVVRQSGKEALKLTWNKVKGSSGYEIYKARICLGGYKLVKTVKNKTVWKDTSVKAGRAGTYKIRAYRIKNDRKIRSAFSYPVSAKVCTVKNKSRNAVRVIANHKKKYKGEFTLNIGEAVIEENDEFKAKVLGPIKKGKKQRWKPINKRVRWFSTDPSIVKVRSATKMEAQHKKGKCYIYAVGHNGIRSNRIPVTVKDYAYEKVDIEKAPTRIQLFFEECNDKIREVCSYYSIHKNKESYELYCGSDGKYMQRGKLLDKTKMPQMKELLDKSPFSGTKIEILPGAVHFRISGKYDTLQLSYVFTQINVSGSFKKISNCWWYGIVERRI